jgi:thiamine pyrophosphate-dependent acetolactate synthase large subunit-like protein
MTLALRLRLRERLTQYNTVDDAVDLIRRSHRIVFLTGAGISNSSMFHSTIHPD